MVLSDEIKTKAMLTLVIKEFLDAINVNNTMNSTQVGILINLCLEDIETKNLKLEDYKLFFKLVIKGEFGVIYNRVDVPSLFEMIKKYIHQRNEFIFNENTRLHESTKEEQSFVGANKEGQKKLIEILKEFKTLPEEPRKNKPTLKPNNQHQKWLDLFWEMFKKNGVEQNGIKFIQVEGKYLTQIEFVEYKIKELQDATK